jgi:hypothetical protein
MDVVTFGKRLLEIGDLDPIYEMLFEAKLPMRTLERWCMAYWLFYDAGVASEIAEGSAAGQPKATHPNLTDDERFWKLCTAHVAERYGARGGYRIHFRGDKAVNAVRVMATRFPSLHDDFYSRFDPKYGELRFDVVSAFLKTIPEFGPAIIFKVCDMLDRVFGLSVDFTGCELSFYKNPLAGGCIVENDRQGNPPDRWKGWGTTDKRAALGNTLAHLTVAFKGYKAPPTFDRPLGVQEFETILCEYKSYLGGHYTFGKTTRGVYAALENRGKLAKRLSKFLPKEPLL